MSASEPLGAVSDGVYSRRFLAWGRFVERRRRALLAVTLLITVFFGWQAATRLQVDATLEAFLSTDAEVRVRLERFRATFGRDEFFLLAVEGDVFTADYLTRLRRLHAEVAAVALPDRADVIDEVRSLLTARRVTASAAAVEVGELSQLLPADGPPSATHLAAFRDAALTPVTTGNLVSADGRVSAVLVRTRRVAEVMSHRVYDRLVEIAGTYTAPEFHVHVGGPPALAAAIHARMLADAYRSLVVALALMAVLLAVLFRHWLAVVAPLAVVAISVIWTVGLIALLGYKMTALHNILPTFLLAVGLGDSVHLISVFRTERAAGHGGAESVVRAVGATGLPIVFTSITTAQGMLGFTFTRLGVTTEFGVFAALGVMFALLHSLVLLPAIMTSRLAATLAPAVERPPGPVDRGVDLLVRASVRHPWRMLACAGALVAATVVGMSMIRVSHDPLRFLQEGHPVRTAFEIHDRHLGGTVNLEVVAEAPEVDGLKDERLVRAWAKLEAHARAYVDPESGTPLVRGTFSILDVLRETWAALNADLPPAERTTLPPDRPAIAQTMLLFEMGGGKDLDRLATDDMKTGRMSMRVPWRDAGSYAPLAEWVDQGVAAADLPPGANFWLTGGVYTLFSVVNSLIEDFITSFGAATLMIAFMLVVLLRSIRLGLLALVPNLLPIFMTLGVMGFAGIPLDMFTLLIGSLAIGITDDDTIHFFHHVAAQRRAGLDDVEAVVRHTGAYAGRAMVATSLILMIGFGAFLTAGMRNLVLFGALTFITITLAALADLVLGPALLRVTWRWLGPTGPTAPRV